MAVPVAGPTALGPNLRDSPGLNILQLVATFTTWKPGTEDQDGKLVETWVKQELTVVSEVLKLLVDNDPVSVNP